MDSRHFENQFFAALVLFATVLMAFIFFPYLESIVLAVVLAILFKPVYRMLLKFIPRWEGIVAFITVLFAIAVIIIPLLFFGFKIFQEAQGLYSSFISGNAGPIVDFLHGQLNKFAPWMEVDFNQYAKQALEIIIGNLGSIFSKLAGVFITVFLGSIAFYYFLKDSSKIKEAIFRISPLSQEITDKILSKLNIMANSAIKGSLAVAVIQGVLVGLGFFIFGINNSVLWGSVAIIAALIPFVGTAIVIIPGILSLVLSGNIIPAAGFALWGILLVGLVDNLLRPRLIERNVKIYPLSILFSVLGGFAVFGATGFLLGPLVLSLFLTLVEIYPSFIKSSAK